MKSRTLTFNRPERANKKHYMGIFYQYRLDQTRHFRKCGLRYSVDMAQPYPVGNIIVTGNFNGYTLALDSSDMLLARSAVLRLCFKRDSSNVFDSNNTIIVKGKLLLNAPLHRAEKSWEVGTTRILPDLPVQLPVRIALFYRYGNIPIHVRLYQASTLRQGTYA